MNKYKEAGVDVAKTDNLEKEKLNMGQFSSIKI